MARVLLKQQRSTVVCPLPLTSAPIAILCSAPFDTCDAALMVSASGSYGVGGDLPLKPAVLLHAQMELEMCPYG